ncbi:MAG: hypothetical protein ACOC22_02455, partial [bacterium]
FEKYSLDNFSANMQLCSQDLDNFLKKADISKVYWSPKIDGVRCWAIINKRTIPEKEGFRKIGYVKYLSRNNKEFTNFKKFDKSLINIAHTINKKYQIKYPIIIDIEVSSKDKSLSTTMTQLRRINNINPELFIFNVFDIPLDNIGFEKRYKILEDSLRQSENIDKSIKIIPYKKLKNPNQTTIHILKEKMIKSGYEGLVLIDGNLKYQYGKRPVQFVKVKGKDTIDLEIIDIKIGETGTRWENMVSALVCDFNGKKITVAGRIDKNQRREWKENPPIGEKAEIEYKEITKNGNLREPIFVRLREEK